MNGANRKHDVGNVQGLKTLYCFSPEIIINFPDTGNTAVRQEATEPQPLELFRYQAAHRICIVKNFGSSGLAAAVSCDKSQGGTSSFAG